MTGVLRARVGGAWVDIPTVGPQGPIGATGATGANGATGAQGPAGPGVATGGTNGQVLAKNSATDFDTGWITPSGGGGGNVSTSGTITVGQYAKWATVTTIQSVTPATVLSDIGAAPLASPTFTGDPKAPTPTTADNDTSVATTAYVKNNLATYYNAATSDGRFQPLDADLTSLAAASATNAIYYRSAANTWATVTMGAGISFTAGTLATGATITTGSVTSAMLTGYADASGTVVRGVSLPSQGLTLTGANLTLANDLAALEALAGTDTIYYRSGIDTWSAVSISTGLTFTGGTLAASAGAGPFQPLDADLTSLAAASATNALYYRSAANTWATVTIGTGLTFTTGTLAASAGAGPFQPLDGDLTSLAAASAIGAIYYRSATDTWATVAIGTGLSFAGGTLTNTVSGGGNVSNSGTPVAGQVAEWTDATHVQGVSTYAKLASPVFTGDPQAPTPATSDNDTSIATTAYVKANLAAALSNVAGVRGLNGLTNPTVASFTFSDCALRDNSGKTVLVTNGNLVISTVAGAGANGPDATLPASGDIHFYAIWGATPGIAGLCSTSAPPGGPAATMPSGYTHYCYLTTVKRVSSNLYATVIRGDWVTFSQSVNVLNGGNSGGSWTSQSMAAALPAIALNVQLMIFATATATGAATLNHLLGHTSGLITYTIACNPQVAGTAATTGMFMLPNVSQLFWYTFSIGGGTFSGSSVGVNVASYQVPNSS